jgi:hypothetical protein
MNKLKLWDQHPTWEAATTAWEENAQSAAHTHPIKTLSTLPKMPGMTPDTARGLRRKALFYLIKHDKNGVIPRFLLRLRYGVRLLSSYLQKQSFRREGDFFLYGLNTLENFEQSLADPNLLLVVGFSYCHKPHECPSGRFTTDCKHDASHPVCKQCFIGQTMNALPNTPQVIPLFITTIHYIGEEMCKIVTAHPGKKVRFLITACEMTLTMFADFGNMIGIKGVGIRLDGRICNTMKAFDLSEKGIKPGLTIVLPETQKKILDWVRTLRNCL